MIKIALADDHHIVRQGLRALLENEPDFTVVGEAGDGIEGVELAERLNPDVLVVDLMMPGLNGLDVTLQLSKSRPQIGIIVLSMYSNEAYVLEALSNGALGYVLKDSRPSDLLDAVRQVASGRQFLSPPLSLPAIESYKAKADAAQPDKTGPLTIREREVLHLAAEGHTSPQIAARLGISSRTAEAHRSNLMHKLGLHSQADLIRYALRKGIIQMDE